MTSPERSVLIVSLSPDAGGAERSMLTLARNLGAAGWRAIVAAPTGETARRAADQGTDVQHVPWRAIHPVSVRRRAGARYPVRQVAAAVTASVVNMALLTRLVIRERPAVLLSNSSSAHLFVMVSGRLTFRPVVWHMRDIVAPGLGRTVLAQAARGVAAIVAISGPVAETLAGRRVHVVGNPVELDRSLLVRRTEDHQPVIGFLGRLDPEKGLETLIRAMADVPAVLQIFGASRFATAGYEQRLKLLAAAGRADVRFQGHVDDPEAALSAIDVLAVPSRLEPWGRVAAEALSAGVPVVASRSGGLTEIVRDGQDGLLVEPADVKAWAMALSALVSDTATRRRMSESALAGAWRFAPVEHARRIAEILDSVVARRRPLRHVRPDPREAM